MTTQSLWLSEATVRTHRSTARGHSDHGWLNTYHSFSFADWYNPLFVQFGALRVLNEDTVQPQTGFPTHPHRDFEIFSYVLRGELTHRDSMAGADSAFVVRRGDVQFTTGGTGIAHSEFNQHSTAPVHFLQIWALPWRRGLQPVYHSRHFADTRKQNAFVPILSPLAAGPDASPADETAALPALPETIPVHADLAMGAALVAPTHTATWTVGLGTAGKVTWAAARKVYVHVPMTTTNRALGQQAAGGTAGGTTGARIRILAGSETENVLDEGDGAFVEHLTAGETLAFASIGTAEAEVIVLDTA